MMHFFRAALCLSLALVAGCSSYNKRFAYSARSDVKHLVHEGAYAGRWTSAANSAWGGDLRCILTKLENPGCGRGDHSPYRAEFHAKWHGLSSTHTVILQTNPGARRRTGGGVLDFEGTSKLRTIIGAGTYMCKGTLGNDTMRACYDSTYDRGTFEMTRVNPSSAGR